MSRSLHQSRVNRIHLHIPNGWKQMAFVHPIRMETLLPEMSATLRGNWPCACICDEPLQTWLPATCSGAAPLQSGRGCSSSTKPKNSTSASMPIEIVSWCILVGRQRKRRHPSCGCPAAQRDAGNLERPLARSLPWWQILYLSQATCQLLYTAPGNSGTEILEIPGRIRGAGSNLYSFPSVLPLFRCQIAYAN